MAGEGDGGEAGSSSWMVLLRTWENVAVGDGLALPNVAAVGVDRQHRQTLTVDAAVATTDGVAVGEALPSSVLFDRKANLMLGFVGVEEVEQEAWTDFSIIASSQDQHGSSEVARPY